MACYGLLQHGHVGLTGASSYVPCGSASVLRRITLLSFSQRSAPPFKFQFCRDFLSPAQRRRPHTTPWHRGASYFASGIRAVSTPAEVETNFEQMVLGTKRKYYMLGGKGGVGKTSLAASLAVKFANNGHSTLVVSTDPAHSLSDSFAQDLTGGMPVSVEGPDSPLFAMEINPEQARAEFRAATSKDGGGGVKDFMDSMGLGGWVEQLGELKLGELLDTPPPGLDEAIAIAKVIQFIQAPEYSKFTRIIFDTAPTGHTLRLLSLPDFLDASIGKILKLKQKLSSATAAIKSVFGQSTDGGDSATSKLELLKERMVMVREIFRNKESTEFVIVTIPTNHARIKGHIAQSTGNNTGTVESRMDARRIGNSAQLSENTSGKCWGWKQVDNQRIQRAEIYRFGLV
ncbi:hypothetical protein L7F22_066145 [Adiantum nelumboides]|nr:hypothetical protein [Adiantum nelumboides]